MKLFFLEILSDAVEDLTKQKGFWFGFYTEPTSHVVLAETEEQARKLVVDSIDDYDRDRLAPIWSSPEYTLCVEMNMTDARILHTQCGTG